MQAVDLPL